MQRPGEFRASVTKDYLVFASTHFITFAGTTARGAERNPSQTTTGRLIIAWPGRRPD